MQYSIQKLIVLCRDRTDGLSRVKGTIYHWSNRTTTSHILSHSQIYTNNQSNKSSNYNVLALTSWAARANLSEEIAFNLIKQYCILNNHTCILYLYQILNLQPNATPTAGKAQAEQHRKWKSRATACSWKGTLNKAVLVWNTSCKWGCILSYRYIHKQVIHTE